jgi:structural maintenance of chromosome 2
VRNFDRSKVKGLVAQLITVDPSSLNQVTALEVCAGGRLYNVVVEDNVTASQLLDNGRLTRKVTMIPLNQIRAFVASAGQLTSASKISNNSAKLALQLIGYDADVSKAMEFVFGNTLVCPDAQTAKQVTFDPNVRMKSVTFDGDIYDPAGTLSGGSKPSTSGILIKVQQLHKVESLLREHQSNLQQIEEEWQAAKSKIAKFNQTKKDLDLKSHEVSLLEERVKESNTTRVR